MLSNSIEFVLFLAAIFAVYWALPWQKARNVFLLAASYGFYACFDWRFLGLVLGLTVVSYLCGKWKTKSSVWATCLFGLGFLGFFKYYNFFIDSVASIFSAFISDFNLRLVLPVGISFFTFKAISYVVDCYKGKIEPSNSVVDYALYISFFPQLAAGPIDRAGNILPQLASRREFDFDQTTRGMCQIAYGLFKKMVIADSLASYVRLVFDTPDFYGAGACVIAMLFYTIQIYCDFSGYSDIACGSCRLFGIEPMMNFDRPYLSKTFSEFWRRWHISLSTWFRDYVYIPLGGSRCILPRIIFNTWVVFVLSGLWHGAAWTFVAWGALHALYLTIELVLKRRNLAIPPPIVFLCVAFAWVLFRSESWDMLSKYLSVMFSSDWKMSLASLSAGQGIIGMGLKIVAVGLLGISYLTPRDCAFKTSAAKIAFITIAFFFITFLGITGGEEFVYLKF